jgi:hypothetical protein
MAPMRAITTRGGIVTGIVLVGLLSLPRPARPQYADPATVVCASVNGERTFCETDTRQGVSFVRQLGDARCVEEVTWGYTEWGIWVDRGCQAEFSVPALRSRRGPDNPYGVRRLTGIPAGTLVPIRTEEPIDADSADGRVFVGLVDRHVRSADGSLAIPRGSRAELLVRTAPDGDLVVDLESLTVNGERYAIRASENVVEPNEGLGVDRRTGESAGAGALLGTIIGAIAGGGSGAAIGAVAGAAAGAGAAIVTRGRTVRIPAEAVLTFRLERPLDLGVPDDGFTRDGRHYHPYPGR